MLLAHNELVVDDKVVWINGSDDGGLGWFFFMAWIGASIYFYRQLGPGIWHFFLAIFKGAVWPAYVIYRALTLMKIK